MMINVSPLLHQCEDSKTPRASRESNGKLKSIHYTLKPAFEWLIRLFFTISTLFVKSRWGDFQTWAAGVRRDRTKGIAAKWRQAFLLCCSDPAHLYTDNTTRACHEWVQNVEDHMFYLLYVCQGKPRYRVVNRVQRWYRCVRKHCALNPTSAL